MDWDPKKRFPAPWQKHKPVTHVPWADVVKSTKHNVAHYKDGLPQTIEKIEMECVKKGDELPRDHPTTRRFWRKLEFVVGASKGEQTQFVYAEWHKAGGVHGRPITEAELKIKGMQ